MSSKLLIDRRRLIKLGLSAGVLANLPFASILLADNETDKLLHMVSDSELPINPTKTGTLSQYEFKTLFTLCQYVNQVWEFGARLDPYRTQLQSDLELKTSRQPSYFNEYKNALELIELITRNSPTIEQTWSTLLFSEFNVENFDATKLGRARAFVFSEIIAHQIPISGAFKSFGLVNHRGHFGGPYTSPQSYRRGVL